MLPWSSIGLGGGLIAVAALVIWIVVLVWLSERILRFIGIRSGWKPLDPRNMMASAAALIGAIHFGNYLIDLLERALRGASYVIPFGFPSAFLIGSAAIGVGIGAVRWHRRQVPPK